MAFLGQYFGDRGIIDALAGKFKQTGLHFDTARECRHGMHAGLNVQL